MRHFFEIFVNNYKKTLTGEYEKGSIAVEQILLEFGNNGPGIS
jgi:hypothetical protein